MPYVPLTAVDLQPNKPARATSFALRVHNNFQDHEARLLVLEADVASLLVVGSGPWPLGGSRQISVPLVASAQDAIDYFDFYLSSIPADCVFTLQVELRSSNAGTSVTPKLRNITDASDVVLTPAAVACSATTWGGVNSYQSFTFTPVAAKRYRLQLIASNVTDPVYGIGRIVISRA